MKKNIKRLCLFFAMGITTLTFAQSTWYFGSFGGIKFNNGTTSPAPGSQMNTSEGCTDLVDGCNNVMFYTDGQQIWNGNHALQSTIGLLSGDPSSTQTAVIVPIPPNNSSPGTTTQAFIFTVNAVESAYGNSNGKSGLRVTLVKISGNAPATAITVVSAPTDYNICLTPGSKTMSEKLTLTPDGSGGYWVLTHGVDIYSKNPTDPTSIGYNIGDGSRFYAYHVNSATTTVAALDATEVSSNVTSVTPHNSWTHPNGGPPTWTDITNQFNGQGQMKMIKTGATTAKIACTLPWFGRTNGSSGYIVNPVAQVFDFNLTTGIVSNSTALEFSLGFNFTNTTAKDGLAYGVEFSPNGKYLYVSSTLGSSGFQTATSRIYQYDLNTWTVAAIQSSKVIVASLAASTNTGFAALQIGPDNKIYIARPLNTFLDVINSPNTGGIGCGYASGIPISQMCKTGLPNSVIIYNTPSTPSIAGASKFCAGTSITATGSYSGQIPASYYWEIYTSDASGNPIDCSGAIINGNGGTYSACFNFNQWYTGTPGLFTFPNSNTLPCNKYYTIKLALSNGCGSWSDVTKIIYVQCMPTPVITSDTPNPICYGSTINLCVNYSPSNSSIHWWNDLYDSHIYNGPQCTPTKPLTDLKYYANVTVNGCNATATYQAILEKNNPDFGLSGNLPSTTSPYFTITATPVVPPGPNIGFYWEVKEIDEATGNDILNTGVYNPNCWFVNTNSNNFNNYNYNVTYTSSNNTGTVFPCPSTAPGQFKSLHMYKITRGTWTASCPWQQVSATIIMGPGRSGEPEFIIKKSEVSYVNTTGMKATSISNNEEERALGVFPNPSTGSFTVANLNKDQKNIFVYDVLGKLVFQKQNNTEESITIDISDQSKGIYFLNIISNNKTISKKIIVE